MRTLPCIPEESESTLTVLRVAGAANGEQLCDEFRGPTLRIFLQRLRRTRQPSYEYRGSIRVTSAPGRWRAGAASGRGESARDALADRVGDGNRSGVDNVMPGVFA